MKILIVMSGGVDTYGPSRHLYHALISDLLSDGHTVHLIESHTSGTDSDAPNAFVSHPAFSYETRADLLDRVGASGVTEHPVRLDPAYLRSEKEKLLSFLTDAVSPENIAAFRECRPS